MDFLEQWYLSQGVDRGANSGSTGPGGGGRTTFRPPWVKADTTEVKPSTVKTSAPWVRKTNPTTTADATAGNGLLKKTAPTPITPVPAAARKDVKLQSREVKVPIMTEKPKPVQPALKPKKPPTPPSSSSEEEETEEEESEEETDSEEEEDDDDDDDEATELSKKFAMEKPKMRPVLITKDKSFSNKKPEKETEEEEDGGDEASQRRFKLERPKLRHVVVNKEKPINKSLDEFDKIRPVLRKTPKVDDIKPASETDKPEFKDKVLKKVTPSIKRNDSIVSNVPAPPPLPSLVPKPPPPPPPPLCPPTDFEKKPLSDKQKAVLDKLKTRPRRRPDWSEMMKEVEDGRKLRHVQCNDRSKPIITCKSMTKVDDKFVYETEKANAHNKLLQQIQGGVRLKPTRCNDRSRPILEGLRKFRRQMTIEEQIHKSESKAALLEAPSPIESSGDELDDIDKLRDDLQSTKQMLALELRNKEAQERENKRLLAKIANLEAELEREKWHLGDNGESLSKSSLNDEALVKSLKEDADEARKVTKDLEKKYQDVAEDLDSAKNEVEEQKRQISALEKKLAQALQGGGSISSSRRPSEAQHNKESSPEIEIESESEEEEDEEKKAAKAAKRLTKEVKMFEIRLTKVKDKQAAAKKERGSLKEAMKKNQTLLKAENKKFKKLEKEVQKMAASMKEDTDDEEKEDEEEVEEEEEEEESEEESESEESEEESESESESESEDENASDQAKKDNLEPRVKRYENRLSALKKGNYLLQANVDNLQDEINKIRDKAKSLQAELDAILYDFGL